jgi:hypothetical protein
MEIYSNVSAKTTVAINVNKYGGYSEALIHIWQ